MAPKAVVGKIRGSHPRRLGWPQPYRAKNKRSYEKLEKNHAL